MNQDKVNHLCDTLGKMNSGCDNLYQFLFGCDNHSAIWDVIILMLFGYDDLTAIL